VVTKGKLNLAYFLVETVGTPLMRRALAAFDLTHITFLVSDRFGIFWAIRRAR